MTQAYFFCSVLGFAFIALSFVVGLFGLGGNDLDGDVDTPDSDTGRLDADGVEVDVDVAPEVPHDGGFAFLRAFSIRSISAGIAFFGLGGLGAHEFGASEGVSLITALVCGSVALWLVYRMMRSLSSFNQNGSIVEGKEKGLEGVVYLRIPAKRAGLGKVTIAQQGRSMEYDAQTDEDSELPQGTPIVVVEALTPSQMLVARR